MESDFNGFQLRGNEHQLVDMYPSNRLIMFDLDVTQPDTIRAVALELHSLLPNGLDHLISNAGVSFQSLASFDEL